MRGRAILFGGAALVAGAPMSACATDTSRSPVTTEFRATSTTERIQFDDNTCKRLAELIITYSSSGSTVEQLAQASDKLELETNPPSDHLAALDWGIVVGAAGNAARLARSPGGNRSLVQGAADTAFDIKKARCPDPTPTTSMQR